MKKFFTHLTVWALAVVMLLSVTGTSLAKEKDLPTITLYPSSADAGSGLVEGRMGDLFAKHGFQVEVWSYSDDKTNAILASGDLPDVMYINVKDHETMIQAGMLLELDEHLEKMPHVMAYEPIHTAMNYVREYRSNGTGKLYMLPLYSGRADGAGTETERYGLRLNWKFFEGIGAPAFDDMWDLIPIMKQMLEKYPSGSAFGTNEDKNYGTVLNAGSDGTYWGNIAMPFYWNGYQVHNLNCLLETDMVEGTYKSILDDDSYYLEVLKWYNALYREGLMDPDSITLDRMTQAYKVNSGNVMVPSGTNPGWDGYYHYMLKDQRIHYPDYSTYGSSNLLIGINAKTTKLDQCLEYLDVIANPDEYLINRNGPEGELWEVEDGVLHLTKQWYDEVEADSKPDTYSTGEARKIWNVPSICTLGSDTSYKDAEGNTMRVNINSWKEFQDVMFASNETYLQWSKTTGQRTWVEWLDSENRYFRSGPIDNVKSFVSTPDPVMQMTIDAIREVVVTASWKMVYAETDEDFDQIWKQMVSDCNGLGAQDVIEWRLDDLAQAKEKQDALQN